MKQAATTESTTSSETAMRASAQRRSILRATLRGAVEQGGLPRTTDVNLLHDVLLGALHYLLKLSPTPWGAKRLEHAVQIILAGAQTLGSRRASKRQFTEIAREVVRRAQ